MKKSIFKEPSTWAGIASIAGGLVPLIPAAAAVLAPIAVVAGSIAMMMREEANK